MYTWPRESIIHEYNYYSRGSNAANIQINYMCVQLLNKYYQIGLRRASIHVCTAHGDSSPFVKLLPMPSLLATSVGTYFARLLVSWYRSPYLLSHGVTSPPRTSDASRQLPPPRACRARVACVDARRGPVAVAAGVCRGAAGFRRDADGRRHGPVLRDRLSPVHVAQPQLQRKSFFPPSLLPSFPPTLRPSRSH